MRIQGNAAPPRVKSSLITSLWLAMTLAACSGSIEYPDETEPGADTGAQPSAGGEPVPAEPLDLPSDGPGLYVALCATCHGEAGAGTEIAPEIQHPPADYFRWVVRNGLEGAYDSPMLAFAESSLDADRLSAILTYLRELPQPSTDQGLYDDYCGNCHGEDARGGVTHKTIAGKNEFLEVLRQGKGGSDFAARARYMPSWQAGELEDAIIVRLEAYVGSLPE